MLLSIFKSIFRPKPRPLKVLTPQMRRRIAQKQPRKVQQVGKVTIRRVRSKPPRTATPMPSTSAASMQALAQTRQPATPAQIMPRPLTPWTNAPPPPAPGQTYLMSPSQFVDHGLGTSSGSAPLAADYTDLQGYDTTSYIPQQTYPTYPNQLTHRQDSAYAQATYAYGADSFPAHPTQPTATTYAPVTQAPVFTQPDGVFRNTADAWANQLFLGHQVMQPTDLPEGEKRLSLDEWLKRSFTAGEAAAFLMGEMKGLSPILFSVFQKGGIPLGQGFHAIIKEMEKQGWHYLPILESSQAANRLTGNRRHRRRNRQ